VSNSKVRAVVASKAQTAGARLPWRGGEAAASRSQRQKARLLA